MKLSFTFETLIVGATSHQFAHSKSATRWLWWLLRNLSNEKPQFLAAFSAVK
jgi:hypothetical protein